MRLSSPPLPIFIKIHVHRHTTGVASSPLLRPGGGNGGIRLTATDLGGGGERGKDCLDNRSFCLVNTERVGIWRGVFYDGNDRGKHRGHV